jgi:hypothetical protein
MKVLEYLWLTAALLLVFILATKAGTMGTQDFIVYGVGLVLAGFMFYTRRNQRLKAEARKQSPPPNDTDSAA